MIEYILLTLIIFLPILLFGIPSFLLIHDRRKEKKEDEYYKLLLFEEGDLKTHLESSFKSTAERNDHLKRTMKIREIKYSAFNKMPDNEQYDELVKMFVAGDWLRLNSMQPKRK